MILILIEHENDGSKYLYWFVEQQMPNGQQEKERENIKMVV